MKRCSKCRTSKPESDFYKNSAQRDGLSNYCKLCLRESIKASKSAHPDRVKRNRVAYLKRNHDKIRDRKIIASRRKRDLFPEMMRSKALARYYEMHETSPCVYVVAVTPLGAGPVKIGHTSNLPHRVRAMQTGSPVRLEVALVIPCLNPRLALDLEFNLRERFAPERIHGEWFSYSAEISEWLSKAIQE